MLKPLLEQYWRSSRCPNGRRSNNRHQQTHIGPNDTRAARPTQQSQKLRNDSFQLATHPLNPEWMTWVYRTHSA